MFKVTSTDVTKIIRNEAAITEDTEGTEFISNATTGAKPKLNDGENPIITTDTNLYLKVDTTQPTIPNVWFRTTNPITVSLDEIPENATDNEKDEIEAKNEEKIKAEIETLLQNPTGNGWKVGDELSKPETIIGGPGSKLYVMYEAKDANGIHKTEVKCGTKEETETLKKYKVSTLTNEVRVAEFDISNLTSGNNKLVIKAYDKATGDEEAGSYSRTIDMNVDNTPPTVYFGTMEDTFYGSIVTTVRGTSSDSNSVAEIHLGISKDEDTEPTRYLPLHEYNESVLSWIIRFDGGSNSVDSKEYHEKVLNDYLDELYPEVVEGKKTSEREDLQNICFWVYAKDNKIYILK